MNREFKFRVWLPESQEIIYPGNEVTGDSDYFIKNHGGNMQLYCGKCISISKLLIEDDMVFMQWTGLQVDGKDLYEGDVVLIEANSMLLSHPPKKVYENGIVFYDNKTAQFCLYYKRLCEFGELPPLDNSLASSLFRIKTILGNIYQNPELLEDE